MKPISSKHDVIARLVPGGTNALAQLSDEQLLADTRRIVGKSNQLLALLLLHLAEVEARGIHRLRRCASIYTYCIYELRFSEDEAARRSAAARLVREFPPLFDAIAQGELHLTGLLMIGPHLTSENLLEVLGRAKFRTKKELNRLLRELNPLPRLADCIEPAGPEPRQTLRAPTWEQFVTAFSPRVRELPPGERPRDWASDVNVEEGDAGDTLPVGPVPKDLPPVTGPQHYQVQFTTVEEHAKMVERAKALMARERPGVTLGELHLEAMKLLVASLEKRKFAVGARRRKRGEPEAPRQRGGAQLNGCEVSSVPRQRGETESGEAESAPRQRGETGSNESVGAPPQHRETELGETVAAPRQRGETESGETVAAPPQHRETESSETVAAPRQRGETESSESVAAPPQHRETESGESEVVAVAPQRGGAPPRRPRHIPASQRREVFLRDAGRCTYVDARGERCGETHYLELHHLQAFAKDGPNVAANLSLRCAAHNALAAEMDFGAQLMSERRNSRRHEAFSLQVRPRGR